MLFRSVYNTTGNAVQFIADSPSGDCHGLFAHGCNRGVGLFGQGGDGAPGSPATAGAGIQGMGAPPGTAPITDSRRGSGAGRESAASAAIGARPA